MTADSEIASREKRRHGLLLEEEIIGANQKFPGYHLYPGDLLHEAEDGSFTKVFPGLTIVGLRLTDEQIARLKPVSYREDGLNYHLSEED